LIPDSLECGVVTNLKFSFTPNQPILQGSYIIISLPYFNANSSSTTNLSIIPDDTSLTTLEIFSVNIILIFRV